MDDLLPSSDDSFDDIGDLFNQQFIKICEETLCKEDSYHQVNPEEEAGLTLVKTLENEPNVYYICPYINYRICKFGPRKRKNYNMNYFYRYILEYDENTNKYILYIVNNSDQNCIISSQVCDFIEKSSIQISEIRFRKSGLNRNDLQTGFKNIYIFSKKFSDKFVKHFPDKLTPGSNQSEFNQLVPIKQKYYKRQFSSNEMYIMFITKLINNGYTIIDENNIIYDNTNIKEKTYELLSGQIDKQLKDQENEKTLFIEKQIGKDNVEKFQKIIEYIKNTLHKNNVYFKYINTLRNDNKISFETTIPNLQKDNNIYSIYDRKLCKIVLYKMFFILQDEKLQSYKPYITFYECLNGTDSMYGIKTVDINDLPIKLKSINDLYTLYYVIGKAIVQCKDIEFEDISNSSKDNIDVNEYNYNIKFNINNFNYNYLNKQLINIINKTCKKYKIK